MSGFREHLDMLMLEENHAEATSSCQSLKGWTAGSWDSAYHWKYHSVFGLWLWKEYKNTSWATTGKDVLIWGQPLVWTYMNTFGVCVVIPEQ